MGNRLKTIKTIVYKEGNSGFISISWINFVLKAFWNIIFSFFWIVSLIFLAVQKSSEYFIDFVLEATKPKS